MPKGSHVFSAMTEGGRKWFIEYADGSEEPFAANLPPRPANEPNNATFTTGAATLNLVRGVCPQGYNLVVFMRGEGRVSLNGFEVERLHDVLVDWMRDPRIAGLSDDGAQSLCEKLGNEEPSAGGFTEAEVRP